MILPRKWKGKIFLAYLRVELIYFMKISSCRDDSSSEVEGKDFLSLS
jgi:hypothetical protein